MRVSAWILGDQLVENHPAIAAAEDETDRSNLCVALVESRALTHRLPYQRKKLVLLLSAMRHYAAALKEKGYQVDYYTAEDMLTALRRHVTDWQPKRIYTMAASQYGGRRFQNRLGEALGIPIHVLPNTQFLVERYDPIPNPQPGTFYVMENFYRAMRRYFNLLLEPDGSPAGGRWNYDALNRRRLPPSIDVPERLHFEPDEITRQVMDEVERDDYGIGSAEGFDLGVDRIQAGEALRDFLDRRLENFGAYEDAMSRHSSLLFHSLLSPYLNLGLLDPLEVARAVENRYRSGQAPLPSAEGFVRQVIGWREFIYWQYWRQMPALRKVNFWSANRPLPAFFWNGQTDMNCLQQVIRRAVREGYSHHIERLMVLSNFCLLAGISPQQVNEWFLTCYVDAYEWVMLPNVLGMGLYADGGKTATKPYIASGKYIHKMGDYCAGCRYQPSVRSGGQACPFNLLYWNFLIQHERTLRLNPRMGANVLGLRHIPVAERGLIQDEAAQFLATLASGLKPEY